MWTIRKPTEQLIERFLAQQSELEVTCPHASVDLDVAPAGFLLDQNRVLLGEGEAVFRAACELLRAWKMFPRDWIEVVPHDAPQQQGGVIASLAWAMGCWWTNPCRIVEIYPGEHSRQVEKLVGPRGEAFGFTYATLPGHVECGAERFLVLRDEQGSVWYDIRAYSRPRSWHVRVAKRMVRRLQKRFVKDSLSRMSEAVKRSVAENLQDGPIGAAGDRPAKHNLQTIE